MEKLLSLSSKTRAIHQLRHIAVQNSASPPSPPRICLNSQLISRADPILILSGKSPENVDVHLLAKTSSEKENGFRGQSVGSNTLLQLLMKTSRLQVNSGQRSLDHMVDRVDGLWTIKSSMSKKT